MTTTLRTSGIQMGDSIMDVSGSAPSYTCRAWVNFNGIGTVAIRASGNVSSITDNGTGDYTVNFTNAMPDANYSVVLGAGNTGASAGQNSFVRSDSAAPSTSSVRIGLIGQGTSPFIGIQDGAYIFASIFR